MARPQLSVTVREKTGRGSSFQIRRKGLIPAILYGPKVKNPVKLTLDPSILYKTLKNFGGLNTLIELTGDPSVQGKIVLVKDLQTNPVTHSYIHADFYAVDLEKKIEVAIPIELVGRPKGVEEGGILQYSRRTIEVRCPVTDIPARITVDVSELKIGDSIHIEEVKLPPNVEAVFEENYTIAAVVPPSKEEELAPPAAPAEAVPVEGAEAKEGAAPVEKEGEEKEKKEKGKKEKKEKE